MSPLGLFPKSLRWRLVALECIVVGVILLAFTGALYELAARNLMHDVQSSLVDRAQQVNGAIRQYVVFGALRPKQVIEIPPPESFASSDTVVQISTLDGQVIVTTSTPNGNNIPLDQDTLQQVSLGNSTFERIKVGDEELEVYSSPILLRDRVIGVLQVARSLQLIEQTLARLRLFAIVGFTLAMTASILATFYVANRSLFPLKELIRTAERVGRSGDLSQRVKTSPNLDEVGKLASTFNTMLERLERSDRQLRETLDAERRFVADASHELRTPLTTILGNAGLLLKVSNMSPEDRQESLEQIYEEADRMRRLVSDLLTLARADAGFRLKQEPVKVQPVVESAVREMEHRATDRQLRIDKISDVEVVGDKDALKQLVLILLDNAIKYTRSQDSIQVEVEKDDSQAVIRVSDTGIGISQEHLPHIFERFYRADTSRSSDGTGLGLSIAKWIVEQHCGSISVVSEIGKGSIFEVKLPAKK